MPHLMFQWVLRRAQARWPSRAVAVAPVPAGFGTPYERSAPPPDTTCYVSYADWVCPTHCVEPAVCPATGSARDWEMSRAVAALAARMRAGGEAVSGPALFQCRHQVYGVGAFAVDEVLAQIGFGSTLGPLAEWGLMLEGHRIVVDTMMRTNLPGVFAAGDVVTYPGKLKLIATGFAEGAIAANHAKAYIDPASSSFPGHSTTVVPKQRKGAP